MEPDFYKILDLRGKTLCKKACLECRREYHVYCAEKDVGREIKECSWCRAGNPPETYLTKSLVG